MLWAIDVRFVVYISTRHFVPTQELMLYQLSGYKHRSIYLKGSKGVTERRGMLMLC
jgi:hypothetical protein